MSDTPSEKEEIHGRVEEGDECWLKLEELGGWAAGHLIALNEQLQRESIVAKFMTHAWPTSLLRLEWLTIDCEECGAPVVNQIRSPKEDCSLWFEIPRVRKQFWDADYGIERERKLLVCKSCYEQISQSSERRQMAKLANVLLAIRPTSLDELWMHLERSAFDIGGQ